MLLKKDPEFDGSETAEPVTEAVCWLIDPLDRSSDWEVSLSSDSCSTANGIGKGAEQYFSETKLGRPTIELK
jgi:hypothetical protein